MAQAILWAQQGLSQLRGWQYTVDALICKNFTFNKEIMFSVAMVCLFVC